MKKFLLYLLVSVVIFAGQFLRTGDLVTGKPPNIEEGALSGYPAMPSDAKGLRMIYFWGGWCGVCRMMQDSVSAVATDFPALTVALRSGTDTGVKAYLREKHLNWPVINDPQGRIADNYAVSAVPALFFLDGDGNIVFTSVGYTSELGLRLRIWLAGKI